MLAVDVNVRRVLARSGLAVGEPTPQLNQALMELRRDAVCTARAPRCSACPLAEGCDGPEEAAPGGPSPPRFEDTARYVRGRVVAALVAAEALPEVGPERLARALDGLERDGLIERSEGRIRLPGDTLG